LGLSGFNKLVGRPVGLPPVVIFLTVGDNGQPGGQPNPTENSDVSVSRSIDRLILTNREHCPYTQSTGRSTNVHTLHLCMSMQNLSNAGQPTKGQNSYLEMF